jgi:hypothetical protein
MDTAIASAARKIPTSTPTFVQFLADFFDNATAF